MALRPRSSVGDRRQAGAARRPKNAAAPSRGANDMSIQLQLSEDWQRNAAWRDPLDQLRQLEQDKLDAKHEIRLVLDRYREKYRISGRRINETMWAMSTICSTISSTTMKRR
jgi:hypothetical protein